MEMIVISPTGVVCHEKVKKIFLPGKEGGFTVLRNHAPKITTLAKGKIGYEVRGVMNEIEIEGGIVEVNQNVVRIITER